MSNEKSIKELMEFLKELAPEMLKDPNYLIHYSYVKKALIELGLVREAVANREEAIKYLQRENCKLSFDSGYRYGRLFKQLDKAKEYMWHKSTCKLIDSRWDSNDCTCGFEEALKYIDEKN